MAHSNGQAVLITGAFGPLGAHGGQAAHDGFDLKNFERLPARDIPIDSLSSGIRLRQGGIDAAHVQSLVDAAESAELPPILVQADGWRVIDGLHRLEAARLRGDHSIKARFLDCTDSEALVIAMKANGAHGLPLSKADRLAGAQRVLAAHPDWSDRAIAGITGLSAKTIASLRRRVAGGTPPGGKRIGRDGRRRPVSPGEGRRRVAEYIAAHPDAPLRQVAKATDVSLGTVHDVSVRLRQGISPERNGRRAAARPRPERPAERTPGPEPAAAPGDGRARLRVAGGTAVRPRRRNHVEAPLTWAAVAAKMANDPAVRYSASGRQFLRWMESHATEPDGGWRQFVDAVPPHWLSVIAPIADRIGREWSLFAEQLRNRQEIMQ
ncbi:ParB/RepB/Spo0J family partition protein [Thermomonospora catenispora]|mgnify:CR=1 FL=1|uniref:ParB/RepB/Spo0J family partition protein n=1 Tax=Thermomonospora catenispora TaxID=2493090 RepID=UPI00111F9530|nr:ParB/RepB/Spo0J family partition protein [Thermomonospora catenispora]TNY36131.1 nuclease [Thermomonospora catenispora]